MGSSPGSSTELELYAKPELFNLYSHKKNNNQGQVEGGLGTPRLPWPLEIIGFSTQTIWLV